uniref:Protein kinase domain-containing protein n=1 Tax=viral metagenome TaxID=1070528 RepID=A0A6C0EPN1_9ZZZZ
MITIRQNNYVPFNSIENYSNKAVVYPDLCSGKIIDHICANLTRKSVTSISVGLAQLTGKLFRIKREQNPPGPQACIFLTKSRMTMTNRQTKEKTVVDGEKGTIIIFGGMFREKWLYKTPKASINLFEQNPLPYIYLSANERVKYANKIRRALRDIENLPAWEQCPQKHLKLDELLGKGSYGNVYKTDVDDMRFAVKLSKLKPEALDKPYSKYVTSWYEVHFLRKVIFPLIQKDICPNLPLIFNTFTCKECELNLEDKRINVPCVTTTVELATGDLKYFLRELKPEPNEIYSALFQVMAAIHAIQVHGQIMNFDVKKENILFYDVEPGGYWQYKIHGKSFYVPNYGKLFILNDFGISRSMSPKLALYKSKDDKTFRLGSRFAMIQGGKFVPLQAFQEPDANGKMEDSSDITWSDGSKSKGAQFRMWKSSGKVIPTPIEITDKMQTYLKKKGGTGNPETRKFFLQPEVVPPFEFYNDTQDGIRTFIGGKRTTQKGYHRLYPIIPNSLVKQLQEYNGEGEGMKDFKFSTDPSQVLAGYFITSFFSKYTEYMKRPQSVKLATYFIS